MLRHVEIAAERREIPRDPRARPVEVGREFYFELRLLSHCWSFLNSDRVPL